MAEEVNSYQEEGNVNILAATMGLQDVDHPATDTKTIEEEFCK